MRCLNSAPGQVHLGCASRQCRFVPNSPTLDIAAPNLNHIYATQGLVLPGETVEIAISAHVNGTTASQLNLGGTHLEDTLVLHTALGRDHFIAVSGDYGIFVATSSLASSLIRGFRTHLLLDKHRVASSPSRTCQSPTESE